MSLNTPGHSTARGEKDIGGFRDTWKVLLKEETGRVTWTSRRLELEGSHRTADTAPPRFVSSLCGQAYFLISDQGPGI